MHEKGEWSNEASEISYGDANRMHCHDDRNNECLGSSDQDNDTGW